MVFVCLKACLGGGVLALFGQTVFGQTSETGEVSEIYLIRQASAVLLASLFKVLSRIIIR